eukprot:415710_1
MTTEVLTINIGECGIRVGDAVWKQYCFEHGIDENGSLNKSQSNQIHFPTTFFDEIKSNNTIQYKARNIMIDTEPDIIENIMETSKYSKLYDKNNLIYGNEDSGNNFAKSYYKINNLLWENIQNKIRQITETFDDSNYIIFNYSIGGGTGSGLSRLLCDHMRSSTFCPKIHFNICPFNGQYSECSVDCYNALFCLGHDHIERHSIFVDNQAIFGLCKNELGINEINYNDLNSLISTAQSFYTDYIRFDNNKSNTDDKKWEWPFGYFSDYDYSSTTWVFPLISPLINQIERKKDILCNGYIRIHYPMNIVAIYDDILKLIYNHYDISLSKQVLGFKNAINVFEHVWKPPYSSMLEMIVDYEYQMEYDMIEAFWSGEKMIICSLCNFRGKNITQKDLDLCREFFYKKQNEHKLYLLDRYYRSEFGRGKYYFMNNNNIPLNDSKLDSQCVLFCNGDPIKNFLERRILKKCEKMYKLKAFWHHFMNEGMEEQDFKDRMETVKTIIYRYQSLHYIGQTDEDYDDDDD